MASCAMGSTAQPERSARRRYLDLPSNQLVCLIDAADDSRQLTGLRALVDNIQHFENPDQCELWLKQTKDTTTFLVIPEQDAGTFLTRVRHMEHIWSVHVYHRDRSGQHLSERVDFRVPLVRVHLDDLVAVVAETLHQYGIGSNEALFTATTDLEHETSIDDFTYPRRDKFLAFLCYLPNPPDYFQKFITFVEEFYQGNAAALVKVRDFAETYRPDNAIQWYTEDTFLYRLLNQALRQHHIGRLFLFGFIIKDIRVQLKQLYHEAPRSDIVKVYRGQWISRAEIQQLIDRPTTQWLISNSFLSASTKRDTAMIYTPTLLGTTSDVQGVLFEIEISTHIHARPYANIAHLSAFSGEDEFLFTCGTQFHIKEIVYDDVKHVYIARLQLDHDYRSADEQEELTDGSRIALKRRLHLLDRAVRDMSGGDVQIIFEHVAALFPSQMMWMSALKWTWLTYEQIRTNDYTTPVEFYGQALRIWQEFINDAELNCAADIAYTHHELARFHQRYTSDHNQALRHFSEASRSYLLALDSPTTNTYERMKIYEHLSNVENSRMKLPNCDSNEIEKILEYEQHCLLHKMEYYGDRSTHLPQILRQLAGVKWLQLEFDESLAYYERAVNLTRQQPFTYNCFLFLRDIVPEMIKICIEEKNNDYSTALRHAEMQHDYTLEHHQSVDRSQSKARCVNQYDVGQSYIELAHIFMGLRQRKIAGAHLKEGLKAIHGADRGSSIDYATVNHGHLQELLADRAMELGSYEDAYRYIKKATQCHREQQTLLEQQFEMSIKDAFTRARYSREQEQLSAREEALETKRHAMRFDTGFIQT